MIASAHHPRLKRVRRLAADARERRAEGRWVAEGVRLGEEVVRSGVSVELWVVEEGWGREGGRAGALRARAEARGDEVLEVKRGLLRELADTEAPQGVLAVFAAPTWAVGEVLAGLGPVVVLDRVQDPGNLGTIARSALGAGAAGLLFTPGSVDPGNPKALRASAGALLVLPAARCEDPLGALRAAERRVVSTTGRGGVPYAQADLAAPFGLVLGQEGDGVSRAAAAAADLAVTIPMAGGLESLNVAAAAAVLLFEAARQGGRR